MADVTIIGGGWSVENVNLERLAGVVIAVNDSALLAPYWHYAVSMDRLWAENRFAALERNVATAARLMLPPRKVWLRTNALQNLPDTVGIPWLTAFECDHETNSFADEPNRLNGTNSGACALNLAWKLRPQRVFLLGFDANRDAKGRAYWYPPYHWQKNQGNTTPAKYGAAVQGFKLIGCEVYNVSPFSAINEFEKITPAEYLKATT